MLKHIITRKQDKKKKGLKLISQRKALQAWFLNIPPRQIYSQFNKLVFSNLKLKDQGQKRPYSKENWLEDVLWKIPFLIHYF